MVRDCLETSNFNIQSWTMGKISAFTRQNGRTTLTSLVNVTVVGLSKHQPHCLFIEIVFSKADLIVILPGRQRFVYISKTQYLEAAALKYA